MWLQLKLSESSHARHDKVLGVNEAHDGDSNRVFRPSCLRNLRRPRMGTCTTEMQARGITLQKEAYCNLLGVLCFPVTAEVQAGLTARRHFGTRQVLGIMMHHGS
jgi:hypothetical protein